MRLPAGILLALAACQGGTLEGNLPPPDAPPDAPGVRPDGGGEIVTGLGQVCNALTACPANAPECTTLALGAANGFCSLPCGTTAAGAAMPPVGSDALCAAQFTGLNSGTPKCTLAKDVGAERQWACAVRCGVVGGTDYGYCPAQLSCQNNLCQP